MMDEHLPEDQSTEGQAEETAEESISEQLSEDQEDTQEVRISPVSSSDTVQETPDEKDLDSEDAEEVSEWIKESDAYRGGWSD